MERLLKLSLLLLFATACAKSNGFKASDYEYKRVEKLSQGQAKTQAPPKRGSIVRDSQRIHFTPTKADWNENNVKLKAKVQIDEDSLGEIEFTGYRTDSRIHLSPVNPELNDKIQAQLICTSDEGTCNEFFIDVFYKENETYFHDQTLAKPKEGIIPAPAPVEEKPAPVKPEDSKKPKDKTKLPQPTPEPAKPAPEELIQDEISDLVISEDAGFVGTPDEEVSDLFKPRAATEDNQAPAKVKDEQKEKPPVSSDTKADKEKEKNKDRPKESKASDNEKNPQEPVKEDNKGKSPMALLEKFRATDQAINSPSRGRLERGTNLFEVAQIADLGFQVKKADGVKDYYSTFGLAQTVAKIAEALREIMPNRVLHITALSKWGGGYLSPHSSHQNGTDADIRYLRNDENQGSLVVDKRGQLTSNFMAAHQWKLFKKAFATNNIEMIFVGPSIKKSMCEEARRANDYKTGDNSSPGADILKRLVIEKGHNDHFHIRVKCTDRRCSRITYNYKTVGC